MTNQLDRIEDKLTRVDEKLDDHLERIAKVEVKADGSIKVGLLIITGILFETIRRLMGA